MSPDAPDHAGDREEDRQPEHDGVSPAVDPAADDPDVVPRGQHGPTADYGEG